MVIGSHALIGYGKESLISDEPFSYFWWVPTHFDEEPLQNKIEFFKGRYSGVSPPPL